MRLNKIFFYNFRNLHKNTLNLSFGTNALVGQNGHGKTNVLESIYFVLTGSSFRVPRSCELVCEKKDTAKIEAEVGFKTKEKIEAEISKRATFKLNGKSVYARVLREKCPIILFEPESLLVVKKGPDLRRTLLDEMVVLENPLNIRLLESYKQALKLRNQILKNAKDQVITVSKAKDLLECSDGAFLDLASLVSLRRLEALRNIKCRVRDLFFDITQKSNLQLRYVLNKSFVLEQDKEFLKQEIAKKLVFEREILCGFTLSGPHMDDIEFAIGQRSAKSYLSQGEQRALVLAIKAGLVYHCVSCGKRPLLLLDDVFSELDIRKREFLANILKEAESQTIITMTEAEKALKLDKLFLVKNGRVDKI